VIVVDTHVWIWWVHQDDHLTPQIKDFITQHEAGRIGVSAISCWEVAKLVERGRLRLPMAVDQWLDAALAYPGMTLLPLTPEIAADAGEQNPPERLPKKPRFLRVAGRHILRRQTCSTVC